MSQPCSWNGVLMYIKLLDVHPQCENVRSRHRAPFAYKTQFIWIGSCQQLANVTVTVILLDVHNIAASHNVTCLGVVIDTDSVGIAKK